MVQWTVHLSLAVLERDYAQHSSIVYIYSNIYILYISTEHRLLYNFAQNYVDSNKTIRQSVIEVYTVFI